MDVWGMFGEGARTGHFTGCDRAIKSDKFPLIETIVKVPTVPLFAGNLAKVYFYSVTTQERRLDWKSLFENHQNRSSNSQYRIARRITTNPTRSTYHLRCPHCSVDNFLTGEKGRNAWIGAVNFIRHSSCLASIDTVPLHARATKSHLYLRSHPLQLPIGCPSRLLEDAMCLPPCHPRQHIP